MIVIELKVIKKEFEEMEVLRDVMFFIKKGFIYGLFGLNGVGKIMLLKIIVGIYK